MKSLSFDSHASGYTSGPPRQVPGYAGLLRMTTMLTRAGWEARLAANGTATAWLACAIGNQRAARFYEKCGWRRVGNMINRLDTPTGIFPLEVWRYEKRLTPHP